MSGSGNSSAGNVLGVATGVSAGTVLASTGSSSSWILVTASISLGLSIMVIALRLAVNVKNR